MEAAHIPWRPLGRLLVEQGLLTDQELEFALAKQQTTGRRLGETIVECGFVSPPDLSNALAAQYGIELIAETGFGTGLRAQIQRRHENDRGRPTLVSVPDVEEPLEEAPDLPESDAPTQGETMMLAQLEEQWARLAAAEEWLAEREVELAVMAAERDRRRVQAERLLQRARAARAELAVERERNEDLAGLTQSVDGQAEEERAKLHAAEELLAERERQLGVLSAERDRRRSQAVRFLERLRAREAEHHHLLQSATGEVDRQRAKLDAAEEVLAERERRLGVLSAERDRRRSQAVRFVERLRAREAELHHLLGSAAGEVDQQRAQLDAAESRLAERERELAALAADRDRRRAQVVRFARRVQERDELVGRHGEELRKLGEAADAFRDQAERLAGDVRGCDAEIDRLRTESTRRRAQAARFAARIRERGGPVEEQVATPSNHLVFVQLAGGYELVERNGPPPPRHSPVELPELCDGTLVVAGSRPSPFPGDARPCVIVQPA